MTPKLQLALDTLSPHEAVDLVARIQGSVDIVELEHPLLSATGLMPLSASESFNPARCLLPT
jgi:3-keto-L-gulonate-6-phosphate decarboxylase